MKNIRLIGTLLEDNIIINDQCFVTLVVENRDYFYSLLKNLKNENTDYHLLIDGDNKQLNKYTHFISDFTELDFSNKSVTSLINKEFGQFYLDEENYQLVENIQKDLSEVASIFSINSELNIEYELDNLGSALPKIIKFSIYNNDSSLLETTLDYISLLCKLKPLKLLIALFAKEFFDSKQIQEIFKFCQNHEVGLLLIENKDKTSLALNEKRMIVDEDLCCIF